MLGSLNVTIPITSNNTACHALISNSGSITPSCAGRVSCIGRSPGHTP